jgi:hypothetical protein
VKDEEMAAKIREARRQVEEAAKRKNTVRR